MFKKQIPVFCFLLFSFTLCNAQIEVDYAHSKEFNAIGFGAFLNFALPVSEADYVTLNGGVQYFKNKDDEELGLVPVLAGYRYTLDRMGTGFYVEPVAGYTYGVSTIVSYETDGDVKLSGPTAGINVGYLFDLGRIPFNVSLGFNHNFGNYATNVFGFRIAHSLFSGLRRDD